MILLNYSNECVEWLKNHHGKMTKDAPIEVRRNYYDNCWKQDPDSDYSLQFIETLSKEDRLIYNDEQKLNRFLIEHNLMGYITKNDDGLISGVFKIATDKQKQAYQQAKKMFANFFAETKNE